MKLDNVEGNYVIYLYIINSIKILFSMESEARYNNIIRSIYTDFISNKLFLNMKEIEEYNIDKNILELIGIGAYGQVYKISDSYCIKLNFTDKKDYHEFNIPLSIENIDKDLGDMILKPYTLIKNCEFNGIFNIIQINIYIVYIIYCFLNKKEVDKDEIESKLVYYNIEKEYRFLFDNENKSIVKKNLHYYYHIYMKYFKKDERINIIKYLLQLIRSFRNKFKNKIVKKEGFIIIMPFAKGNISVKLCLNPKTKEIDKNGLKAYLIKKDIYRMLFLQIALFFLKIRKHVLYLHNDLKPDNILVMNKRKTPYVIKYNNLSFIFYESFIFKISDFDFSLLPGIVENNKINKLKLLNDKTSWFLDFHNFTHKLFHFISETEIQMDKEFFEFIYNKFIKNYCDLPFKDIQNNTIIRRNSITKCDEGIYRGDTSNIPISKLEDIIKSDMFNYWRHDSSTSINLQYDDNTTEFNFFNDISC